MKCLLIIAGYIFILTDDVRSLFLSGSHNKEKQNFNNGDMFYKFLAPEDEIESEVKKDTHSRPLLSKNHSEQGSLLGSNISINRSQFKKHNISELWNRYRMITNTWDDFGMKTLRQHKLPLENYDKINSEIPISPPNNTILLLVEKYIRKGTDNHLSDNNIVPKSKERFEHSSKQQVSPERAQILFPYKLSKYKYHQNKKVTPSKNEITSEYLKLFPSDDKIDHSKISNFPSFSRDFPMLGAQRRYAEQGFKSEFPLGNEDFNKEWDFQKIHLTTITVGTLMLFLILVVMVLALRVHWHSQQKLKQEWIKHPIVQPLTANTQPIQPSLDQVLSSVNTSTEPIRIKAKGLLERRGSNTSLTIDLGSANESTNIVFSPTRECLNENFLMTAGNRMSRRQLRLCLKNSRSLHSEFWQIPTNHPEKCSVPGAAAKNRYRTVLPNEETRVVLHRAPPDSPETPASQYINANYIRGYDGEEKAFIATQGPLAHTIEDLWLLVLQERSPAIIMITRLKEKGRVKCEPYVPSYSACYGSIQVTVKQILQKNGYTIREIQLKRDEEIHTTLHFWFTSWPDHKTPSSARHLLAMSAEVEMARKGNTGPVIVHCSAGIGRTGCFIAVNIAIKQLLEEDCVDILNIVCQMRLDRGGMVQTAEQYEFIHRALAFYEASLPCNFSSS